MAFKDKKENDKLYGYDSNKELIETFIVKENRINEIVVYTKNKKEETIQIFNANNNQQSKKDKHGNHYYLRVNKILAENKKVELKNCLSCKSFELCKSKSYLVKNHETSFCTAYELKGE